MMCAVWSARQTRIRHDHQHAIGMHLDIPRMHHFSFFHFLSFFFFKQTCAWDDQQHAIGLHLDIPRMHHFFVFSFFFLFPFLNKRAPETISNMPSVCIQIYHACTVFFFHLFPLSVQIAIRTNEFFIFLRMHSSFCISFFSFFLFRHATFHFSFFISVCLSIFLFPLLFFIFRTIYLSFFLSCSKCHCYVLNEGLRAPFFILHIYIRMLNILVPRPPLFPSSFLFYRT